MRSSDDFWNLDTHTENCPAVFVISILDSQDPQTHKPDFIVAEKNEVDRLMAKTIWKKVDVKYIPPGAYSIGNQLLMNLKTFQTPRETLKV